MTAALFTVVIAALLAMIPASIAAHKGHSYWTWYVYGFLLWIVALVHALLLKTPEDVRRSDRAREGYRPCPYCAEMVRSEAIVCRFCGRDLAFAEDSEARGQHARQDPE